MKYATILTFALIALMVQSGLGQGMTFETGQPGLHPQESQKGEKNSYTLMPTLPGAGRAR
ncbi:MAG: hypothetical protein IPI42_06705 [Saprospiraceae bacterium]|nr:hypothetical protein [Candidatus Parvibacillus calidus]